MKKTGRILLACLALAALDAATLLLFFSVWDMAALDVFPFALLNIMAVTAIFNLTVLLMPYVRRSFHTVSPTGLIASAVLYDAFTLVATGLTYAWIEIKWYLVVAAAAFAAYLLSLVLICLAGRREADGSEPAVEERISAQDMQALLLELEAAVQNVQGKLSPRQYESLCRAYADLRDRVYFSTPFGRINKPVVMDMEKRIADRVRGAIQRLAAPPASEAGEWIGPILSSLMDATELIKNKEKLVFG